MDDQSVSYISTVKNEPIIKEVVLKAPVDKVWKAITDRQEMKQWYFDVSDFKTEKGFEFSFEGKNEVRDKTYVHLCKITEVIEKKKLAYTWRYKDMPGVTTVTFELFPEGNNTRLRLTHEGIENLAAGGRDYDKKNFIAGWDAIIGQNLPGYLEKTR